MADSSPGTFTDSNGNVYAYNDNGTLVIVGSNGTPGTPATPNTPGPSAGAPSTSGSSAPQSTPSASNFHIPLAGPYQQQQFTQTYAGHPAPYANIGDQIFDTMDAANRVGDWKYFGNKIARYDFAKGGPSVPGVLSGGSGGATGGGAPPLNPGLPGGPTHPPITIPPVTSEPPVSIPYQPPGVQFSSPGLLYSDPTPMPKDTRSGGLLDTSGVPPKAASAGRAQSMSPADVAFLNVYRGPNGLADMGSSIDNGGLVMPQSDYDFLAGNVSPYDIAGVSPALRQQARAAAIAQDPKAAALWDRTPSVNINYSNGHYTTSGSSRRRGGR